MAKRWEHHTPSGGYDTLAHFVDAEVVRRRTAPSRTRRIASRVWRRLSPTTKHLVDYRYEDWLSELYVLGRRWSRPPDLVHFLYGDEQLDLVLRNRARLPGALVATFHLPPGRVQQRFETVHKHLLAGIDAAIVVGQNQLPDFARWFGPDRLEYVPHGINTDRFCPGPEPRRARPGVRLLAVGHHMRDWKAMEGIVRECGSRNLPVRLDVVPAKDERSCPTHFPSVQLHKNVPEEELIRLYREADALLLPVSDATATNAALEALACGTPVITNRVGGMPGYVDDTCGWLFDTGEVSEVVRLISRISSDPDVALSLRVGARNRALEFSWERVAERIREVYQRAINRRFSRVR